ncbi:MAG: hypothetical protein KKG59_00760 [Nanoarchaeota archaeon]|nr:hypothetical protein [Nanoarchaeota archaeon]
MALLDFLKPKTKIRKIINLEDFFVVESTKEGNSTPFQKKVAYKSLILLIIGRRGSGKTALGMSFLEFFHEKTRKKCCILGFEKTKLPRWIQKVPNVKDAPLNSTVLIDEGGIVLSSRDSMKDRNKEISKIMTIARHKNLSLIFISQNSAMIDLNVLRLADTLLLKEPSLLQAKFERKALKDIYEDIKERFKEKKEKAAYFFVWDDDYQGMMKFDLPEFWDEGVSKSFR